MTPGSGDSGAAAKVDDTADDDEGKSVAQAASGSYGMYVLIQFHSGKKRFQLIRHMQLQSVLPSLSCCLCGGCGPSMLEMILSKES